MLFCHKIRPLAANSGKALYFYTTIAYYYFGEILLDMFEMYNRDSSGPDSEDSPSPPPSEGPSYGGYGCPSPGQIFVVSAGGSIFFGRKPDTAAMAKFSETIRRLASRGNRFVIVAGGGQTARNYVAAGKTLGANNYSLDKLGILATRLNASLLIESLERAHPQVFTSIEDAPAALDSGKVAIFGGLMPSFTTDAVAALIAESLNANFINLSDVDGVYSADPKKNPRATFYPALSYDRLISLMKFAKSKPGQKVVLDLPCCLILRRSNIKAMIMNGHELDNFERAVNGEEFKGTTVEDSGEEPISSSEDIEDA